MVRKDRHALEELLDQAAPLLLGSRVPELLDLELGEDRSDLFEPLLERGRARGDCRLSAELLGERSDRLREPSLLISEELSGDLLCVEELEELLSLPGQLSHRYGRSGVPAASLRFRPPGPPQLLPNRISAND
jgi:hypothetical protein